MTRLDETFARLRASGERALVAFFTAGDPSLADTHALVAEAARRGADVIELGVPFSDPIADGPVIQRAGQRALRNGVSLARVIETVRELRTAVSIPIVLFTYYNPVLAFGLEKFAHAASEAGADGVIVVDLPLEEADPLANALAGTPVDLVQLVAPTTPPARAKTIAARSQGFIYVVSLTGVTGERSEIPPDLAKQMAMLRRATGKPLCVGFGIARPEHAAAVGALADGVAVGSAIVRLVEQHAGTPMLVERVGEFIASLKAPLRKPSG